MLKLLEFCPWSSRFSKVALLETLSLRLLEVVSALEEVVEDLLAVLEVECVHSRAFCICSKAEALCVACRS
eukprot:6405745-Amphidinium_carterae.1